MLARISTRLDYCGIVPTVLNVRGVGAELPGNQLDKFPVSFCGLNLATRLADRRVSTLLQRKSVG